MEDKIIDKLVEMNFKESETKQDLWGKPDGGDYLNWDFRKSDRGRFFVVLSDDSFEKDKVSKERPEYVALRQVQDSKEAEAKPEPPVFEPVDDSGKINLVIKDISPEKAIEILKHLNY